MRTGTTSLAVRVAAIILALAALLVPSCAPETSRTDEERVAAAVRAYNGALPRAFELMDMNQLNQVATEDQAATEYLQMAALGEARLQMLSTLMSLEFGDVTFSGDSRASVTTTETWDYEHVSLDTSETVRSEHGITYHLRYDLVFQNGRWLVDRVTSLDASDDSPKTTQ